jgi:hypothetical protein
MRIVGTLWTLQTFNLPRYPDQPKKKLGKDEKH